MGRVGVPGSSAGMGLLAPPGTRGWQGRAAAFPVDAVGALGDQLVNVCTTLLIHKAEKIGSAY